MKPKSILTPLGVSEQKRRSNQSPHDPIITTTRAPSTKTHTTRPTQSTLSNHHHHKRPEGAPEHSPGCSEAQPRGANTRPTRPTQSTLSNHHHHKRPEWAQEHSPGCSEAQPRGATPGRNPGAQEHSPRVAPANPQIDNAIYVYTPPGRSPQKNITFQFQTYRIYQLQVFHICLIIMTFICQNKSSFRLDIPRILG